MRFLLYTPYGYALLLIVLGFVASYRSQKRLYFWVCLLLAEGARTGQLLFLAQNFGIAIYVFSGPAAGLLRHTGLYIVEASCTLGLGTGIGLYATQKKPFPGLFIAGLSLVQLVLTVVLHVSL